MIRSGSPGLFRGLGGFRLLPQDAYTQQDARVPAHDRSVEENRVVAKMWW